MHRSKGRGRLTYNAWGWRLDPDIVDRRLRVLLHRKGTDSAEDAYFSVACIAQYSDIEAFEQRLYDRVVYLARYLRQDVDKMWALDQTEASRYEAALDRWLAKEHGVQAGPPGGPAVPLQDPWGFGDYEE